MRVVLPLVPKALRWAGVVAVAAFIFYASVLTDPPAVASESVTGGEDVFRVLTETVGFAQDQWRHFAAYGTLGAALAYAVADWGRERWQRALVVVGVAVLYGLGVECTQYFIPERAFDVRDIVANTLGAVLVLPWYLVCPAVERRPLTLSRLRS
jgi:VanZ family protein